MCRDAPHRDARSRVMDLLISLAKASRRRLDSNLAQDLGWLKRGGQKINKEIVCLDNSFAAGAHGYHFGSKRDNCRGPVARRIRVRQATADRSLVSNWYVTNARRTVR